MVSMDLMNSGMSFQYFNMKYIIGRSFLATTIEFYDAFKFPVDKLT